MPSFIGYGDTVNKRFHEFGIALGLTCTLEYVRATDTTPFTKAELRKALGHRGVVAVFGLPDSWQEEEVRQSFWHAQWITKSFGAYGIYVPTVDILLKGRDSLITKGAAFIITDDELTPQRLSDIRSVWRHNRDRDLLFHPSTVEVASLIKAHEKETGLATSI